MGADCESPNAIGRETLGRRTDGSVFFAVPAGESVPTDPREDEQFGPAGKGIVAGTDDGFQAFRPW